MLLVGDPWWSGSGPAQSDLPHGSFSPRKVGSGVSGPWGTGSALGTPSIAPGSRGAAVNGPRPTWHPAQQPVAGRGAVEVFLRSRRGSPQHRDPTAQHFIQESQVRFTPCLEEPGDVRASSPAARPGSAAAAAAGSSPEPGPGGTARPGSLRAGGVRDWKTRGAATPCPPTGGRASGRGTRPGEGVLPAEDVGGGAEGCAARGGEVINQRCWGWRVSDARGR